MPIGPKLKHLRESSGESLQAVADAIGVSKAYVWQLERGEGANPSVDVLKSVADHYKTTVAALIGESLDLSGDQQMMRMFRNLEDLPIQDRDLVEDMITSIRKRRSNSQD